MLTHCEITPEHPLGKGEVVSSILTGSTTNPHGMGISGNAPEAYSAVSGRTEREHDKSGRGKSVESVRAPFDGDTPQAVRADLRAWMKKQPRALQPYVRNVLSNLDIILGKHGPDLKEAARKQLPLNIAMLERARAKQTKDVA